MTGTLNRTAATARGAEAWLPRRLGRFVRDERGAGTVTSLYFGLGTLLLGGVALDGSNAYREYNQLQVAADAVALAAAAHVEDPVVGRQVGAEVAARNLGADSRAILPEDIVYVRINTETNEFTVTDEDPNAAMVVARRTGERQNPVSQFVLQMAGVAPWNISVRSVAAFASDNDEQTSWGCAGALVMTTGTLHLGGSNRFNGAVCLHGEEGLVGGGSNYFGEDVRLSAANFWDVDVGDRVEGSAQAQDITFERSLSPTVIPLIPGLYTSLAKELSGKHGQAYTGDLLPDLYRGFVVHVLKNNNTQFVEYIDYPQNNHNERMVVPKPNTIYFTTGSASFAGNMDASHVAVIAGGTVSSGGGNTLSFKDVFFLGRQRVQLAGDIDWGDVNTLCEGGEYGTYLLSAGTVSFGGSAGAYGILAAAPVVSIGGSFTGMGGLYIESDDNQMSLGGNAHIDAYCETPLQSSALPTVQPYGASTAQVRKASIIR